MQKFEIVLSSNDSIKVTSTSIESLLTEISKAHGEASTGYIMVSTSEDKKIYVSSNHIVTIIPLEDWE